MTLKINCLEVSPFQPSLSHLHHVCLLHYQWNIDSYIFPLNFKMQNRTSIFSYFFNLLRPWWLLFAVCFFCVVGFCFETCWETYLQLEQRLTARIGIGAATFVWFCNILCFATVPFTNSPWCSLIGQFLFVNTYSCHGNLHVLLWSWKSSVEFEPLNIPPVLKCTYHLVLPNNRFAKTS